MKGGMIFTTEVTPGWAEVDEDRVLHLPIVFRYFKEAEAQLYRSLGVRRGDLLRELEIWMPRVETHCTFDKPIRYDQPLEIAVTIGEIADKTITYDYRIATHDTQELLAEGYLTILIVSGKEFEPIQVSQRLRELLNPYIQKAASGTASGRAKHIGQVDSLRYESLVGLPDKPQPESPGKVFHTQIRVASTDIDPAGLVYFGSYPYFLMRAEDELFCAMGHPRPVLERELNAKLFRKDVHFRFKKAATYGDLLEASLRVAQVTRTALTYRFQFFSKGDGSLLTEGYVTTALVSTPGLEPIEIPEKLVRMVNGLMSI